MPDSFLSRVQHMEKLEKKATPGPWTISRELQPDILPANVVAKIHNYRAVVAEVEHGVEYWAANGAFIAAARNLMPDLLEKLEQQRKALQFCSDMFLGGDPLSPLSLSEAMSRVDAALADSVEEPK